MNIELWSKRKKIVTFCLIILALIFIIFLWNYFFSKETNWKIYSKNIVVPFSASQVIYYGPDINSNDQNYSGRNYTNGTLCIYALYSRFDIYKNQHYKTLRIVGNIDKIYNTHSKDYLNYYYNEIDKYYYQNNLGSYTEYPD